MTLWLLSLADSATSRVCLLIGCLIIVGGSQQMSKRHPGFPQDAGSGRSFVLYLILAFGFDINGETGWGGRPGLHTHG